MEIPITVLVISAIAIFVIAFAAGFIARYRFDRFVCFRKAEKNVFHK